MWEESGFGPYWRRYSVERTSISYPRYSIQLSKLHAQYIEELNRLLWEAGFNFEVAEHDFFYLDQVVTERTARFSRRFTSIILPPIREGEFYHYTRNAAAESILKSMTVRLYSVKKRISEHEIRHFLESFGYPYPLEIDPATGIPRYASSLAERRFYLSLTSVDLTAREEKYFWDTFAGVDGTRFRFRIKMGSGHLRSMAYGERLKNAADLLRRINDLTDRLLKKKFHWDDSSYVCALHLPKKYAKEKEVRLIVGTDWGLPTESDGKHSYLTLRFGDNPLPPISVELLEVESYRPLPAVPGVTMILRT